MDSPELSPRMKRFLLAVNCFMLFIGICTGPLVMRLYYLHGGSGTWLSAWFETGGWPIMIIPLLISYYRRRAADPTQAKLLFIKPGTSLYAATVGIVAGAGDFFYAYGLRHIPVTTSSLILATQLGFTAVFAFILVRQKFTSYSINAIALLTFSAIVLAHHSKDDSKLAGESYDHYYLGFFSTLLASSLFALMLPMIELTYRKCFQTFNYSLVMEIQLVLSLSATIMCTIAIFASGEYQMYGTEMEEYGLGKVWYFVVLILSAVLWQCFYLGAVGVIYYGSSMLSGVIIAVALPVTELASVVFYETPNSFEIEKGISLILSLWGFLSYYYGESKKLKKQKKRERKSLESIYGVKF